MIARGDMDVAVPVAVRAPGAHYLIRKGVLVRPYYCNIFLGSLGSMSATPFNLAAMVRALPEGTVWSATRIGRFQFYVNSMAIAMGGHVRVGLEDSLYYDREKVHLATNAGLIERVVKVAGAMGHQIASPDKARRIIGLSKLQPRIRIESIQDFSDARVEERVK
ncbi:MAG: 3-keto-5-aminohexanoate cleavage protein [Planctomycetes bacterium]|nr:3-keto-5-aminohexanoate cleavage protein [Planctomycetota bacterium]